MKIKLNTRYANSSVNCEPGQIIELKDDEAKVLIEKGYAVSLEPEKKDLIGSKILKKVKK